VKKTVMILAALLMAGPLSHGDADREKGARAEEVDSIAEGRSPDCDKEDESCLKNHNRDVPAVNRAAKKPIVDKLLQGDGSEIKKGDKPKTTK
jgi:hypothetical protein